MPVTGVQTCALPILKVSKLKGGKKYYVRVCAYKKVGGKYYYSAWSKAKAVKTKK